MTIIVNGSNTPTAGAVGYGDGTNLAFTSAGTTGQFLQSNGSSAPSWVGAPASAMTLISTQTASGAGTNISWTGLSGYNNYIIILDHITANSGSGSLSLLFGSSGTYYTSGYNGFQNLQTGSYTSASQITLDNFQQEGNQYTGGQGVIYITDMTSGFHPKLQSIYTADATGTVIASGFNVNSSANMIQLNMTSTYTILGTASLYGISS